jgi:hypothetical protein
MMQEFMKLLSERQQKQGGPRKGHDMEAKAAMAKELSDMLGEDLTEGIKDSKRVTVASDSEEGLKKGLEKAEDILESKMEDESEDSKEKEDESEMSAKDMEKPESSEDETEMEIADLEKKLEELKAKRK